MADNVSADNEMQEIIDEFVIESREMIEGVTQDMVAIEKSYDHETINKVFRAVHTVKGTSSFLGFEALSELAHKSEDVLGLIRKEEIIPDSEITDTLLASLDIMRSMLEEIDTGGKEETDAGETVEKLQRICTEDRKKIGEILVEEKVLKSKEVDGILQKQGSEKEKKFGEIVVEEKLLTERQVDNFLTKQKASREDRTIRIDIGKLDELMNLVGELVLGKNRLMLLSSLLRENGPNMGPLSEGLGDVTSSIEGITNELQLAVMRARLVPISRAFNKIPRLLRDLSAEFGKDIELSIEGEETELDRSLIEALHDPLIHLIRNSVDHGIEMPSEREDKGKNRKGVLRLRAYNEGNHVVINIYDDGKGINIHSVKEKAREKGLISDTECNTMNDRDALNLIFAPGLSTAKKVSSVSGRGVGMDVVKTNIEKLNGQVFIDSELGQWTSLTMKLPLTLAIVRALIVTEGDEIFAIPLSNVVELVKSEDKLIKSIDKNDVLVLRELVIPVIDLEKIIKTRRKGGKGNYLVICDVGKRIVGIKVDAVIGQEEVVIKSLGGFLGNVAGVSGASIRGDGKVVLILDIPSIVTLFFQHNTAKKRSHSNSTDRAGDPSLPATASVHQEGY
jgi:two-component system chemotaxis sensor kinase CheA